MSSLKDKLKLAAESAKTIGSNILEGKDVSVDAATYDSRMAACQACPKWNRSFNSCRICGCSLLIKAKLADMKCPLGKWDK